MRDRRGVLNVRPPEEDSCEGQDGHECDPDAAHVIFPSKLSFRDVIWPQRHSHDMGSNCLYLALQRPVEDIAISHNKP